LKRETDVSIAPTGESIFMHPKSARRSLRWTGLLVLPLMAGCAVFGYPGGIPSAGGPAPARTAAAPPPVPPASAPTAANPGPPPAGVESYVVSGERYYVLASAAGYRETGLASWYGGALAGRATSSGERFDPRALTAAHRSLPLATRVEVTNLENGSRVVLRINDRGPFADTDQRIIDVSQEAARILGFLEPGLARVEVRAITPGPPDL
jgi:rare lipoprotein A